MIQLQAGSTQAYQQLLDKHLPLINRYIIRMLDNANEADDITQEVFIRLWQKAHSFNPRVARLSTWLHKIAHNLCIDHFRKNKIDPGNEASNLLEDMPGGSEPQTALLQQRQHFNIKQAMNYLSERQRSAIIMCHYQGLSNKFAAEVLEISVVALESLLSRARKKLRENLPAPTD